MPNASESATRSVTQCLRFASTGVATPLGPPPSPRNSPPPRPRRRPAAARRPTGSSTGGRTPRPSCPRRLPPRRSRARRTPRPRRAGRSEAYRRIRPCLAVDLVLFALAHVAAADVVDARLPPKSFQEVHRPQLPGAEAAPAHGFSVPLLRQLPVEGAATGGLPLQRGDAVDGRVHPGGYFLVGQHLFLLVERCFASVADSGRLLFCWVVGRSGPGLPRS